MAKTGREASSSYGIREILSDLVKGDQVVFEAGGWKRKQPLTVTHPEGDYVSVESNRGTLYDLVYTRGRGPYVPDQGEITWIEVV